MTLEKTHRSIRSFVLRQGRITPAQQRAINDLWPQYGLTLPSSPSWLHWDQIFGRDAPRVLEIGFGMGDPLVAQAKANPEIDFIGVEVHQPGVGHCLATAQKCEVKNLKVFCADAVEVFRHIPPQSLDKVLLLFPDPWPKKKHHKRRLVQPDFVMLIAEKLKSHGLFHLATDWQPYAEHMLTVCEACPLLVNQFGVNHFAPTSLERLQTKFERRGEKLGHVIYDLVFFALKEV
ncbi:MAG: tRNA (guanosine(46)-N7)-methyltransferase TrmB [Candidatus Berkiellales bacterium]